MKAYKHIKRSAALCLAIGMMTPIFNACLTTPDEDLGDEIEQSHEESVNDGGVDGMNPRNHDGGSNAIDAGDEDQDLNHTDGGVSAFSCESQNIALPIDTTLANVNGASFLYAAPESPKALALFFHGGNGSKEDNLHERIEAVLIAREAMVRGYAVAALDSAAHSIHNAPNTKWSENDISNNPDIENTLEMVDYLKHEAGLDFTADDPPLILIGFSNGGSMASRVAQAIEVTASAIYISNAVEFHETDAVIPSVALIPGENDPGHALDSNTTLYNSHNHNIDMLLSPNSMEAITPGLFQRIPGVNCELSSSILEAFLETGVVDEDRMLMVNPKSNTGWQEHLPSEAQVYFVAIRDVLIEAYAGHSPSSDKNEVVFDFLDALIH